MLMVEKVRAIRLLVYTHLVIEFILKESQGVGYYFKRLMPHDSILFQRWIESYGIPFIIRIPSHRMSRL